MSPLLRNVMPALAGITLLVASAAQAQTTGGWTLNLDNTGYNPMQAGGLLPYTIRIDNNDNVARPATTITFDIPTTAAFVGTEGLDNCVPAPPTGQPATVTCDVPPLATAGVLSGKVILRPMVEGTLVLRAKIPDPGPEFSRQTTIQKGADLALSLQVPALPVQAGSIAQFGATLTNIGPYDSNSATLVLPIPAGLSSTVTAPPGCSVAAGTITCTVTGLATGASVQLDFAAQVTTANASTITVAATVTGNNPRDGVSSNNQASGDINVTPGYDLSLGKARSPSGSFWSATM